MKQTFFTAEDFQAQTSVSRETLEQCKIYVDVLKDWNSRMNLVARSTLDDVWHRHMLDSAQVFPLISQDAKTLVDLGSGAGFPGLVLAAMGVPEVHLVESTGKKAAFLQAAADEMGVSVKIHNARIEALKPFVADVITARALAPLKKLLSYAQKFSGPDTKHIYLKGQHIADELTDAHKMWNIKVDRRPSITDPRGSVLSVSEVSYVQSDRIQSPSSPSG
ncbi:MAG: 16S rRNA (guanine(527)-N(7))-methyltransferase RsmG [Rhodospirillaceae bacterium]